MPFPLFSWNHVKSATSLLAAFHFHLFVPVGSIIDTIRIAIYHQEQKWTSKSQNARKPQWWRHPWMPAEALSTHLPLVPHIYASVNWVNIVSDNGLSPGRRQAIIWNNADILSIRPPGTHFNEILFEINLFSFKKMRLNMSSAKLWPFCPGEDELTVTWKHLMNCRKLSYYTCRTCYRWSRDFF